MLLRLRLGGPDPKLFTEEPDEDVRRDGGGGSYERWSPSPKKSRSGIEAGCGTQSGMTGSVTTIC